MKKAQPLLRSVAVFVGSGQVPALEMLPFRSYPQ